MKFREYGIRKLICAGMISLFSFFYSSAALPSYFTTQWSSGDGGYYNEGLGLDADTAYLKHEKDGKPWDTTIKPAYNNYHCMVTSPVEMKVSPTYPDNISFKFSSYGITRVDSSNGAPDVLDIADSSVNANLRLRNINNVHVSFLNFGQYPFPYRVNENDSNVQVLINVRPGSLESRFQSLYTIIFPPLWKKGDRLPMKVYGGGYGTTITMTMAYDPSILSDIGLSTYIGAPYIVIYTNHGGHESLGINSIMMSEISCFLSSFMPKLGGDPARVTFEGASRGGTVALSWGAGMGACSYQTKMIKSRVAVTKLGDMFGYSMSVFPDLAPAMTTMLGSTNAWRFDYCGLNSEEKAGYVRKLFTGFQERESANAQSPYGFLEKAEAKRFDSTCILVCQGTHDGFMPMPGFLQLDSMMTARGILHVAQYGFGYGHDFYGNVTVCNLAFDSICRNRPVTRANGREYYFKNYVNENFTNFSQQILDTMKARRIAAKQNLTDMPFSVSIPYRVLVKDTIFILLMGKNGYSWVVDAREESGYTSQIYANGIFGVPFVPPSPYTTIMNHRSGSEFQVLKIPVPSSVKGKRYEWSFRYNGCEIPNRFTPKRFVINQNNKMVFRKTITEIIGVEETYNDYRLKDIYDRFSAGYNFGIDQLHPLLQTQNYQPVLDSIVSIEINPGDTAKFTVAGYDPDFLDTLVYDVRFAESGTTLPGAVFNGKTGGLFLWPTNEVNSGKKYNFVAVARDGKGGKTERNFSITVRNSLISAAPAIYADGNTSTLSTVVSDGVNLDISLKANLWVKKNAEYWMYINTPLNSQYKGTTYYFDNNTHQWNTKPSPMVVKPIADIQKTTIVRNFIPPAGTNTVVYSVDTIVNGKPDSSASMSLVKIAVVPKIMCQPSISVNELSSSTVSITGNNQVNVALNLAANDWKGITCDYFIYYDNPAGERYYYNNGIQNWQTLPVVSYQGILSDLKDFSVLKSSGLPVGGYKFTFAIDNNANGILDNELQVSNSIQLFIK